MYLFKEFRESLSFLFEGGVLSSPVFLGTYFGVHEARFWLPRSSPEALWKFVGSSLGAPSGSSTILKVQIFMKFYHVS